ncbi:MAG: cation-translocating P-type ATPase [Dehalococcoidia bacterium]
MSTPPEQFEDWHQLPVSEALTRLGSRDGGLTAAEAERRLREHGPNELVDRGGKSPFAILWEQLTAVMVLILVGAAGLSLALGKVLEAGAILAIVVLFALLGFFQEYRAEKAIAALRRLAVPVVRVRRDGAVKEVSAPELVTGDVVLLEAGTIVPADLRLIEQANLRIEEAALTGESEPVEKRTDVISRPDTALGDRTNLAYMGTQVSYGRGVGVVTATGMATQLGRIATLLQSVKHQATPLQKRLDSVGKQLAVAGVVVAAILVGIGLLAGESMSSALLTAVSVAVAVIPEGLPAVVTFTLALGAQRMLRRHALIRKLPAVETLGSVTVICSDKTGTLTQNRMTVTAIEVAGQRLGIAPDGAKLRADEPTGLVLLAGVLCNDAEVHHGPAGDSIIGDPTEGALLTAAKRFEVAYARAREHFPRVAELPFDSTRKRMATVHHVAEATPDLPTVPAALLNGASRFAVVKGAVDGLLDVSTTVWRDGSVQPLGSAERAAVDQANNRLAGDGIRVLGIAIRPVKDHAHLEDLESELTFVGLVGMIDPPRPEVKAAVSVCAEAGIRPVMITGDHPLTAAAIARELGISKGATVVTGVEISKLDDAALSATVRTTSVFARVSPEHKLRIVAALQGEGEVVAMTGDGVNDAPALKKAQIGVAMGITGTDVTKEASDMVLRDDNFATIVAAVEEGRVIYDNLRRFVIFAVAGNIGKVMVMLLWPALFLAAGMEVGTDAATALLPLQLLWLNLMTDGLLGLSMGAESAEKNVMRRRPHAPSDGIFSGGLGMRTAAIGALIGVLALAVGFTYYRMDQPEWQTMMFTTLAFLQVFQAIALRSHSESIFKINLFGNRVMVGIVALVVGLQLAALYIPPVADDFLKVEPLGAIDLLIAAGIGSLTLVGIEIEKLFRRSRRAPAGHQAPVGAEAT